MRIVQPSRDTIEAAIDDPLAHIDDLVGLARFYVSNVAEVRSGKLLTVEEWRATIDYEEVDKYAAMQGIKFYVAKQIIVLATAVGGDGE